MEYVDDGRKYTFKEIDQMANKWANLFSSQVIAWPFVPSSVQQKAARKANCRKDTTVEETALKCFRVFPSFVTTGLEEG